MSYYAKYLKYKQKYLLLKKEIFVQSGGFKQKYLLLKKEIFVQSGGFKQSSSFKQKYIGGRRVNTSSNSGARDGMSNQCLWISILEYLNTHGHADLTLRELRTAAGLDASTENTMFDIVTPAFRHALLRIVEIYNLRITFLPIDGMGNVLYNGEIVDRIGHGANNFEIAQYGAYHFEYVTGNAVGVANNFVPYVAVKKNLKKLNTLPADKQGMYNSYNNNLSTLEIIKKILEEDEKEFSRRTDEKFITKDSKEIDAETKASIIKSMDTFLSNLTKEIATKRDHISQLSHDISLLREQITLYEKTLA